MELEIEALKQLDTWELVELSLRRKVVFKKWVYDAKWNGEGVVVRPKARLVARGFTQVQDIDFQEVYSPVSRYSTVPLVTSVSVKFGQKRRLSDVKNAFFNACPKELI